MTGRLAFMLSTRVTEVPPELLRRCQRVDELVKKIHPDKSLSSSQLLATIVEQWERERRGE